MNTQDIDSLQKKNAELVLALQAVVAVADRETDPFIRARALLAEANERRPTAANAGQQAQRAIGRAEAVRIIMDLNAEDGMDEYIGSHPVGDTGEWDAYWKDDKLRALLRADDTAWSLVAETENKLVGLQWRVAEKEMDAAFFGDKQPAADAARPDATRLDFMIGEGCRIEGLALKSGARYRVDWPDLDESQPEWFVDPRTAIDAVMPPRPDAVDGQQGFAALLSEALGVVEGVPSTYGSELAGRIRAALTAPRQPAVGAVGQDAAGLAEVLEKIDLKAEAGLCAGTFGGARAFHQDIREMVAAAQKGGAA